MPQLKLWLEWKSTISYAQFKTQHTPPFANQNVNDCIFLSLGYVPSASRMNESNKQQATVIPSHKLIFGFCHFQITELRTMH
jgi:hypothetical protein